MVLPVRYIKDNDVDGMIHPKFAIVYQYGDVVLTGKQRLPNPHDRRSNRLVSAMPPSYNGNTAVLYSAYEDSNSSGGSK